MTIHFALTGLQNVVMDTLANTPAIYFIVNIEQRHELEALENQGLVRDVTQHFRMKAAAPGPIFAFAITETGLRLFHDPSSEVN